MEKYGFIYVWYDNKSKMYYIGSHWGTESDGYICSSNRMRNAYRRRPQDFNRRVVSTNISKEKLLEEEHKWLDMIPDEQLGKRYYNLRKHKWGHWSTDTNRCLTVAQKISISKSDKPGAKHSEETKQKIREARSKQKPPALGHKHSEETKQKMSKPKPPRTEEHKLNISLAKKGSVPWNKGLRK